MRGIDNFLLAGQVFFSSVTSAKLCLTPFGRGISPLEIHLFSDRPDSHYSIGVRFFSYRCPHLTIPFLSTKFSAPQDGYVKSYSPLVDRGTA